MKLFTKLIFVLLAVLLAPKAYSLGKKYFDAKKLDIGVDKFRFPKLDIYQLENITTETTIGVTNPTDSAFDISNLHINVFGSEGTLIAKQKIKLDKPVNILPQQKTTFPLTYLISSTNIEKLIKQAGGLLVVGGNYLTTGNYGLSIVLKGYVVSSGLKIDINETIKF